VTDDDMPPPERPRPTRQHGQQEHLREDVGRAEGPVQGAASAEHLKEDTGQLDQTEHVEDDKGLIDKNKDKPKGS
jgi:hypothetical protein